MPAKKASTKAAKPTKKAKLTVPVTSGGPFRELEHLPNATRIRSGLLQLKAANKIGDAEILSAKRWLEDYELGELGTRNPEIGGSSGSATYDNFTVARLDAFRRSQDAKAAIGPTGYFYLQAFVFKGLSLSAIAEHLERVNASRAPDSTAPRELSRNELAGAIASTLYRLAEHYAAIDNASRRLPSHDFNRIKEERRAAV